MQPEKLIDELPDFSFGKQDFGADSGEKGL